MIETLMKSEMSNVDLENVSGGRFDDKNMLEACKAYIAALAADKREGAEDILNKMITSRYNYTLDDFKYIYGLVTLSGMNPLEI